MPTLPILFIRTLSTGSPATSPFVDKARPWLLPKVVSAIRFIEALTVSAELPESSSLKNSNPATFSPTVVVLFFVLLILKIPVVSDTSNVPEGAYVPIPTLSSDLST